MIKFCYLFRSQFLTAMLKGDTLDGIWPSWSGRAEGWHLGTSAFVSAALEGEEWKEWENSYLIYIHMKGDHPTNMKVHFTKLFCLTQWNRCGPGKVHCESSTDIHKCLWFEPFCRLLVCKRALAFSR
jgi:hypothetical protein